MVISELETRSATTHSQPPSSKWLRCIETFIFTLEWNQVTASLQPAESNPWLHCDGVQTDCNMLVNVSIYKLNDDYLLTFKSANLSESDCSHTATVWRQVASHRAIGSTSGLFFFYRAVKLIKKKKLKLTFWGKTETKDINTKQKTQSDAHTSSPPPQSYGHICISFLSLKLLRSPRLWAASLFQVVLV